MNDGSKSLVNLLVLAEELGCCITLIMHTRLQTDTRWQRVEGAHSSSLLNKEDLYFLENDMR